MKQVYKDKSTDLTFEVYQNKNSSDWHVKCTALRLDIEIPIREQKEATTTGVRYVISVAERRAEKLMEICQSDGCNWSPLAQHLAYKFAEFADNLTEFINEAEKTEIKKKTNNYLER